MGEPPGNEAVIEVPERKVARSLQAHVGHRWVVFWGPSTRRFWTFLRGANYPLQLPSAGQLYKPDPRHTPVPEDQRGGVARGSFPPRERALRGHPPSQAERNDPPLITPLQLSFGLTSVYLALGAFFSARDAQAVLLANPEDLGIAKCRKWHAMALTRVEELHHHHPAKVTIAHLMVGVLWPRALTGQRKLCRDHCVRRSARETQQT